MPDKIVDCAQFPRIVPDYIGVTIPEGIAPLRFEMQDGSLFKAEQTRSGDTLWTEVTAWKKGSDTAVRYAAFPIFVSKDAIDPFIAYRLIEPGYENWHDMGIYQRELASFKETPIVTNRANDRGCVNCHNFAGGDPSRFLFHARGKGGGTVFVDRGEARLVNLTQTGARKQGVYPAWHPSGRWVAFASCKTYQRFHLTGSQPIEVYDETSDIILMDTRTDSTWCIPGLSEAGRLETFPAWSPDGSRLYFCCADTDSVSCADRGGIHYAIRAVDFDSGGDSTSCRFIGKPRTIWSDEAASASFPRINGKWLLFTKSDYATFPIWHREADLWLLNLESGELRSADPLNSPDTESYHSWSSNGRWVVFSSRRGDGRYTRLYIAHFDGEGHFGKPFLLPQRKPEYNRLRLQSYNVPEFICGKVDDRQGSFRKLLGQ